MAANVRRRPSRSAYVRCVMDLPGPSCERAYRAGAEGNSLAPERDLLGRPSSRHSPCSLPATACDVIVWERATVIPVDVEWLTRLCPRSRVVARHARRAPRLHREMGHRRRVGAEFIDTTTLPWYSLMRPTAARPSLLARSLGTEHRLHAGDVLTVTATSRRGST